MELQLKNIGMIKEANVKLDGLTVIAGENDTGKSTLGRAYYYGVKNYLESHIKKVPIKNNKNQNKDGMFIGALLGFGLGLITDTNPLAGAVIGGLGGAIKDSNEPGSVRSFKKSRNVFVENIKLKLNKDEKLVNTIMIETPYSLNMANYIKTTQLLASQRGLQYTLGDHIIDLILQLSQTPNFNKSELYIKITNIIDGSLYYDDERDNFFYYKDSIKKELEMNSTATGIKMFGFLQILLLNGTIQEGTVLVLDEPEVHLHPKWQLKYAELIVELVKNGVNILITSHSPYMIEALQRYSELEKVNSDFYLAEDGYIDKVNDSNAETLEKIFEKLSEPFDVFEEMDSQSMEKLING
jgi:predicted ATPase